MYDTHERPMTIQAGGRQSMASGMHIWHTGNKVLFLFFATRTWRWWENFLRCIKISLMTEASSPRKKPLLTEKYRSNWSFPWEPAFQLQNGDNRALTWYCQPSWGAGSGRVKLCLDSSIFQVRALTCSNPSSDHLTTYAVSAHTSFLL